MTSLNSYFIFNSDKLANGIASRNKTEPIFIF